METVFKKVIIACDKHGETILNDIKGELEKLNVEYRVVERRNNDYVYVTKQAVLEHNKDEALILACGTGIGVMMLANKFSGIRASLCVSPEFAYFARQHEDCNALCLASEYTDGIMAVKSSKSKTIKIIETFLTTPFAGGRHEIRVQQYSNLGSQIK